MRPATSSTTCTKTCRLERVTTRRGRGGRAADLLADPEVTAGPGDVLVAAADLDCQRHGYLPAFPALRRMTSPWYRTPLPLYGSGLRSLRMLAATSPTCCLSMPETENRVGASTAKVMPSGALTRTGWLKPSANSRSLPLATDAVAGADDLEGLGVAVGDAQDHVGDQGAGQAVQRAVLPLVVGPGHLQGAVLGAGDLDGLGHACADRVPLGPFTVTARPSMATSTPAGTGMGSRPMRDMSAPLTRRRRGLPHPRPSCRPGGRSAARTTSR